MAASTVHEVTVPVVAIIGAGASYASGDYAGHERPPLTRDLFRVPAARALLRKYPLAQKAGQVVERDMKADTTLAFEQALLNLRQDSHDHRRMQSIALPLYLQELLLNVSNALYEKATRYDALLDELLKLPTHVHFVSLNYDVLLDNRLGAFHRLSSMESYISASPRWSLIKPHGSVNWFVELTTRFEQANPGLHVDIPHGPIECVPSDYFTLDDIRGVLRGAPERGAIRYPAIALPEGPKDQLVLPREHLNFLQQSLASAAQVDILVLGYSALDTEVLDLIRNSETQVRRMTIVNRDADENLRVHDTIQKHGIGAVWPDVFDGSFADWVDNDGLASWVREYGGLSGGTPYPSLVAPHDLKSTLGLRALGLQRTSRESRSWASEPT